MKKIISEISVEMSFFCKRFFQKNLFSLLAVLLLKKHFSEKDYFRKIFFHCFQYYCCKKLFSEKYYFRKIFFHCLQRIFTFLAMMKFKLQIFCLLCMLLHVSALFFLLICTFEGYFYTWKMVKSLQCFRKRGIFHNEILYKLQAELSSRKNKIICNFKLKENLIKVSKLELKFNFYLQYAPKYVTKAYQDTILCMLLILLHIHQQEKLGIL